MKMLLYCTKAKPELYNTDKGFVLTDFGIGEYYKNKCLLNGKIVGECDFEVERINVVEYPDYAGSECYTFVCDVLADMQTKTLSETSLLERSCLSQEELYTYLDRGGVVEDYGYAIHIKNLVIYDKPKELSDFTHTTTSYNGARLKALLQKAPQNMMYIEDNGVKKILISVKPQWMCLIANRIKDIEVRRVILKEMI